MVVEYRYGNDIPLDEVIDLYTASTLGERRPIDDRAIVEDMMRHANLVVSAWDGHLLVGIARSLTDFSYVGMTLNAIITMRESYKIVAYLSDLAVRTTHQGQGIGTTLIAHTRTKLGPRSRIILLAAPKVADDYIIVIDLSI
jgi:ribosomal protein S18 acetylase RimI-like enzyme